MYNKSGKENILKMSYVSLCISFCQQCSDPEILCTKLHTFMHEYTLVHMLCKLLPSIEALLKSLEKPAGQAGFHLGGHSQGGFELCCAEKFTELEKNVKKTNQQSNKLKSCYLLFAG